MNSDPIATILILWDWWSPVGMLSVKEADPSLVSPYPDTRFTTKRFPAPGSYWKEYAERLPVASEPEDLK